MLIAIRIVGFFLIILGGMNLIGLLFTDLSVLISPATVGLRYSLMLIAGLGFLFAYKWSLIVYFGSLAINWFTLFAIYKGQSAGPLWLSLPIPIVVALLSYIAWDEMKPITNRGQMDDA
jgi:hypothetical protein